MKKIFKYIALLLLGSNTWASYRIRKIENKCHLTIINLHRVCCDDGSSYKPLDPKIFEELIRFLLKNFTLTTFHNLEQSRGSIADAKPLLIISFDDGYKDFIEVAVPLLFKYHVRVNQNLIPECVDSGQPPFNVTVQDFIGKSSKAQLKELTIPGFPMGNDFGNRILLGLKVSAYLKNKPMSEQLKLKNFILKQINSLSDFQPSAMMTLRDVAQIMNIHEVGAHSYSHASMDFESDDYLIRDLGMCKRWFMNNFNYSVDIYAFPNGSYKEHQITLVREAGFRHILLVNDKFSSPMVDNHNRFSFYGNSNSEMRFRAAGGFCVI
jgi:peptidoglycan/xylan/chitin deacetylase (PgdA/CDA1 family)